MDFLVFSGSSNRSLAEGVVQQLGMKLGDALVRKFSDGEIFVRINESVRGRDVFVIQSTHYPAESNIMELMIMVDALKRASAGTITAIIPYYGYARQDRTSEPRVPITAKLVANLITTSGVDRVVTMNLHAGQIQGFFDIPVDNLYSSPVFHDYFKKNGIYGDDYVVVSPDAGGTVMARAYSKALNCQLAIVDKRRTSPNVAKAMNVIGDVSGKKVLIVDDMIDTAGTLTEASHAVMEHGAIEVSAAATHAVLSGPAIERILESPLKQVIVTDTISLGKEKLISKVEVLPTANIFAEAIKRIYYRESISSLFNG